MPATLHIAVVDTETTGLSAATDRIIEVAVKLLAITAAGELINEVEIYQSLHDPGIRIPRDAIAVHGITDAMVRGHRIDAAHLAGILARADLVVAHNSGFDKGFVRQVVPHADTLLWGCSCRGIPWKQHYPQLWSTSLPVLARFLKLPTGTAHRALGDVETTVNLRRARVRTARRIWRARCGGSCACRRLVGSAVRQGGATAPQRGGGRAEGRADVPAAHAIDARERSRVANPARIWV